MLDRAREHMRAGDRRVLLVAPTGAGKRLMACHTIGEATRRGKQSLMLVHRQELLDQASETLRDIGIKHGIIKSGASPEYRQPVQVASVQSLARRLRLVAAPDFLFVDEFHHAASDTFSRVLAAWPQAFVLGFTATPARLDGRGLAKYADALVVGPSVRDLIDRRFLAGYRLFAPPAPDVSAVATSMGDYERLALADAIDRPKIVGDVIAHYRRIAGTVQALCFAVNIQHSEHLAAAFNAAGISAEHVDGRTPRDHRRSLLRDFEAKRFRVLCSVDILGEGLDVVGIEAVICARPTKSLTLCLQQWGRGLRPKPDGSKCIILDHAGNSSRHGLPDAPREWVLTAGRVKRQSSAVQIRTCPKCFAVTRALGRACPECRYEAPAVPRNPLPEQGNGALVETTNIRLVELEARRRRQWFALVGVARKRGHPNPELWARRVIAKRGAA